MPHIRMRAMQESQVKEVSRGLVEELAQALGTAEDNFTLELVPSVFFQKGLLIDSYPFVEVLWFERSQEIQDHCAKIITEKVKAATRAEDVVVVFQVLPRFSYYENGRHF